MAQAVEYDENGNPKPAPSPFPFPNTGIAGPTPAAVPGAQPASGGYNLEKMRKGWAYGGGGFASQVSEADLDKFLTDNAGGFAGGVTRKGDKLYDPSGKFMFDAIGNLKGGDPSKMTRIALDGVGSNGQPRGGKPTPKLSGPMSPGGLLNLPPGGSKPGGPAAGSGGGFNTGGLGGESKGLFDLLMKRAQASESVDPNDPVIKAQTDAFDAKGQQTRRDFLAGEAEAGGAYGNMRSETRRSAEALGQSTGNFQAQAMQQELSAKRSQIESALSGAAGFLTEQQRMSLQSELTKLQLAQQESQFGRNLKQQGSQFDRNYDQQDRHFDRNLGQRAYEWDTGRYDDLFA